MKLHRNRLAVPLFVPLAGIALTLCAASCFNLRTQSEVKPIQIISEVKPIHITVDINIKVDRELDDFFGDVDKTAQQLPPK